MTKLKMINKKKHEMYEDHTHSHRNCYVTALIEI